MNTGLEFFKMHSWKMKEWEWEGLLADYTFITSTDPHIGSRNHGSRAHYGGTWGTH